MPFNRMRQGQFVPDFNQLIANIRVQRISKATLHVDQAILKKIKRIQQSKIAATQHDDDSDDDDRPGDGRNANKSIMLDDGSGDDDFDTLIDNDRVSKTAKKEPMSSRPDPSSRATQAADEEESEEDDDDETIGG
jgi:hypothetical protein